MFFQMKILSGLQTNQKKKKAEKERIGEDTHRSHDGVRSHGIPHTRPYPLLPSSIKWARIASPHPAVLGELNETAWEVFVN